MGTTEHHEQAPLWELKLDGATAWAVSDNRQYAAAASMDGKMWLVDAVSGTLLASESISEDVYVDVDDGHISRVVVNSEGTVVAEFIEPLSNSGDEGNTLIFMPRGSQPKEVPPFDMDHPDVVLWNLSNGGVLAIVMPGDEENDYIPVLCFLSSDGSTWEGERQVGLDDETTTEVVVGDTRNSYAISGDLSVSLHVGDAQQVWDAPEDEESDDDFFALTGLKLNQSTGAVFGFTDVAVWKLALGAEPLRLARPGTGFEAASIDAIAESATWKSADTVVEVRFSDSSSRSRNREGADDAQEFSLTDGVMRRFASVEPKSAWSEWS